MPKPGRERWILGRRVDTSPNNPQNCGEVSSYPPAIHCQAVGWFDNDAVHVSPVTPLDEATRILPVMGGRDNVLAAPEAMEKIGYSVPAICWRALRSQGFQP